VDDLKEEKIFQTIGNIILVLMLVWCAVATAICVHSYVVTLPVSGWYNRIPKASTAEQIAEYCSNTLSEMDRLGITEGHYAFIFKNPNNDIAVDRAILVEIRDRAVFVGKYDKGSMDYAESLKDIRTQFGGIQANFWYWYMANRVPVGFLVIPWVYLPITLIVFLGCVMAEMA